LVETIHPAVPRPGILKARSGTSEALGLLVAVEQQSVVAQKQLSGGFRKGGRLRKKTALPQGGSHDLALTVALALPGCGLGWCDFKKLQVLSKSTGRVAKNLGWNFCSTIFGKDNFEKIRRSKPCQEALHVVQHSLVRIAQFHMRCVSGIQGSGNQKRGITQEALPLLRKPGNRANNAPHRRELEAKTSHMTPCLKIALRKDSSPEKKVQ
jgi:hypothetical protein